MAARRSAKDRLLEKRQQLDRVKAEIEKLQETEATRIARLALRAGLVEVDASDDELTEAFKELAARFRAEPASPPASKGSNDGTIGQPAL